MKQLLITFKSAIGASGKMNIKTVSRLTGLSAHTLRYYEKINILVDVKRSKSGFRDYSETDLVWIELITRLKATNMPLEEIRGFAQLRVQGDSTIDERVEILQNHRKRVERQMQALIIHQGKIDEKIAMCRKGGALKAPENCA